MRKPGALIALMSALIAALSSTSSIAADSQGVAPAAGPPALTVGYRTPSHPKYQRIYDNMAGSDLLRKSIEPMVRSLPQIKPFNVQLQECESEVIDFVASERTMRVCYEAMTQLVSAGLGLTTDPTARSRIPGSVAAYAITRAVANIYVQEGVLPQPAAHDAADELFVLAISTTDRYSEMAHDVSLWLDASAPRSERRAAKGLVGSLGITNRTPLSFACLLVGSNPTSFADVSTRYKMTPEQVDDCRETWLDAYQRLARLTAATDDRDSARVNECVRLFQGKRLEAANACFTALIESQAPPAQGAQLANLLARRAIVQANLANMDSLVRDDITRARALNPREPLTYSAEGEIARRDHDWKAMEEVATRGLAEFPAVDQLKLMRATARLSLNNRSGAAEDIKGVVFSSPDQRNAFVLEGVLAGPGTRVPRELTNGKRIGALLARAGESVIIKEIGTADAYAADFLELTGKRCTVGESGVHQNGFGSAFGVVICDGKSRFFGDFTITKVAAPSREKTSRP